MCTYPSGGGSQTDNYWYNALGQRTRHYFSGGYRRYVYAGDRVLEVTNDAGDDVQARYTLAGSSYFAPLLHMWFPTDVSRFPLYDGVGTIRTLSDSTGAVTDTWALNAFGEYLSGSGSSSTKYQYGGAWGYMTDPSGLLQLGARFYWPELGRFVQQDPIGDGMNWYAYAGGNPVVYIDPTGLFTLQEAGDWYMGGMGGASDWVDNHVLGGTTQNFGNTAGLYDSGCASRAQIYAAGAAWGDQVVSVATFRPRGAVTNAGRRGGKKHIAAVAKAAASLARRGYKIIAGGRKPERRVPTPGGSKPYRYPDLIGENPSGKIYGNVGRASNGTPVRREAEALRDLNSTGTPTEFFPF